MARGRTGSEGEDTIELPQGWSVEMAGRKVATFRNRSQELEVMVRAVRSGSKHGPGRRDPVHYVVRLHSLGVVDEPDPDGDRSAKAETRREAYDVAQRFMERCSPDPV